MLDSLKPGTLIGERYEITRLLGRGGMGVVYQAVDRNLQRSVALKMIRPDHADDPDFARRFATEAQAGAKLDHPNILRIYDFYQQDGYYFMISPFIEGETLKTRLHQLHSARRLLPIHELVQIAGDVCDGLSHAHSNKVIHRDIKPENLILQSNGLTVIMDFGVAKILGAASQTKVGGILGTPEYMSPEQASGKIIDARSDLYSLGVILFEMATGRRPFEGESSLAVLHQHVHDQPPKVRDLNPGLPSPLVAVIERALEKDADRRYSDAKEMARSLRSLESDETETVTIVTPAEQETTIIITPGPDFESVASTAAAPRVIYYDFDEQERGLRLLVDDCIEPFQREQTQRAVGRDFVRRFRQKLEEAQSSLDDDFSLVVVGDFNRGKSTLINALLRSPVVTTDLLPETVTFNQIGFGDTLKIEAHLPDGGRLILAPTDLKSQRLSKLINSLPQKPTHLSIETPNQWLRGIQLVDTPGLGDLFGSFDPAVLSYLAQADAVIYVISALAPLAASERAFLQFSLRPYEFSKICFVVNSLDSLPTAAEADQVIDLIRNKLGPLFPNAQVFGLSALAEYKQAVGNPAVDPVRAKELHLAFERFRQHLNNSVISNRHGTQLERTANRVGLVLQNCREDLERLQSTITANRAQVTAAIAQCEDENSDLRKRIVAHKDRVYQGVVGLGEETVTWMNEFIDRLRTESIAGLANCKYDDLQRHFTFFLSDSFRSALLLCLDFHHARIVEYLRLDSDTTLDIGNLVPRSQSAGTTSRLGSQIGFEPDGWKAIDSVHLLWSAFGGLLGTVFLSLVDKNLGESQRVARYQKHLLQALPDLKVSVAGEIRRHYMQFATQLSGQLETAYGQQIQSAVVTLQQANDLYGLEAESFDSAKSALQEIVAHIESTQGSLSVLRERLQGMENDRVAAYLNE